MATVAEQPKSSPAKKRRRRSTEPFGGGIPLALISIGVTLIGFWQSFFTQLHNTDALHMWHGATSTGWLVLVLVQAGLIKSHQYKLHRILGWSSVVLFTALLVSSWQILVYTMQPGPLDRLPFEYDKLFVYSDVSAVPLMIICYVGAIVLRKDRHVHSRLISTTLLAGLLPAVARMFNRLWTGQVWPGVDGLVMAMHPTYIFVLSLLAFAIFVDWKNDRLRWPFPFAFVWMALCYATIFPAWKSEWFDGVARAIAATY